MDLILQDFRFDLERVQKLLELIQSQESFAANHLPPLEVGDSFTAAAVHIWTKAQESQADFRILVGTMVLYLGGRFEDYIRSQFEALCDTLASKCNSYDRLPKEMRSTLITMTAKVMESPRKYGHAEKGVENFVRTLAANLSDKSKLDAVNVRCLSITDGNMRSEVLAELFARIGIKDIWKMVGEQTAVKTHFETEDSVKCASQVINKLNGFMETRNGIAHPSGNVNWPNEAMVLRYIEYFDVIANAIADSIRYYGTVIPAKALAAGDTPAPAAGVGAVVPPGASPAAASASPGAAPGT